ncbi:MAG TPA: SDR family NAD(P)-dependent oxidoreductase [Rhodanobacteraceae bacterium]|nr:SDR family NAD(P)-dependent oxidoreductase [Rhodanobacteraceae bacterium]
MSAAAVDAVDPRALEGRVVLIVGANGGLGEAAARACARAGAKLVLLGRRVPKLNRLHDAIASDGGESTLYPLDLEGASPDDYADMAARIDAEFGRLDGLLHCAANFRGLTPLALTDPADFARAVHVNLTARWWLTQACLPLLGKSADAAVVFALDEQAPGTRAYWGGYGLAQAGQVALVDMLQAELGPKSPLRVSGFSPGPMRTSLRANAFVAEHDRAAADPSRAAAHCVELLSPAGAVHRGQVWSPA